MTKIEASIIIERPVSEVWKLVTDFSRHSEWCAEGEKMEQTSPGPLGVGSTFMTGGKIAGLVNEYEPNRRLTEVETSGPGKGSTLTYTFEPIEGGKTRLREASEFRPSGFYRLLWPFVAGRITRKGQANAERGFSNVKRILESQVAPA
jgi:uncharacterized protein YndB with AHSA1/START domain